MFAAREGSLLERATRALLMGSVPLIAFSSGAGSDSVVVAYALIPITAAVALFALMTAARPEVPTDAVPALLAGSALVAALILGLVNAPVFMESAARVVPNVIGFGAFAYVLSARYAEPRDVPRHEEIARVIVMAGAVIAAYFIVRFGIAVTRYGLAAVVVDRVVGGVYSLPWGASNVVVSPLILPIFLTFYLGRADAPARTRAWMFAARVVMLVGVGVALSRGATAALAVGLVLCLFVLPARSRGRLLGFLITAFVALVVADYYAGGVLYEEMLGTFLGRLESTDAQNLNGRTEIWARFLDLFLEHPLLGVGYYASPRLMESTGHNFLLTSLAERGIIGTVLSAGVLVVAAAYLLAAARRARTPRERLLVATLAIGGACSVFHLLVEDANFTQQYMVLSWLALALPLLVWRDLRDTSDAAPPGANR